MAWELDWKQVFDGSLNGPVHAATTGTGNAIGWTETAQSAQAAVVATDDEGDRRWSDRATDGRRLTDLLSASAEDSADETETTETPGTAAEMSSELIAVGTRTDESEAGWAITWRSDGTRQRTMMLDVPGDGPATAARDGASTVLAGTSDEGWWLQRRKADWSVDWTRSYGADRADRGVEDIVVRSDGYGLLAYDEDGTVVLRTESDGTDRWRGRYAPHTTDDDEHPDRGYAMVPVANDEFVVAGFTMQANPDPENEGLWWAARVGEPGATTPADVVTPTATPGPTTMPTRQPTPTSAGTDTTTHPPTMTETPGSTADETVPEGSATASASPGAEGPSTTNGSKTGSNGPGFGILTALGGLAAWLAKRHREW